MADRHRTGRGAATGVVVLLALPLAWGLAAPPAHAAGGGSVLSAYVGAPGVAGSSASGQLPAAARLEGPAGLATSGPDLYVADPAAHDVVEVVGLHTRTVAGEPGVAGTPGAPQPGPATATALVSPTGLLVQPDGTLLIADPGAHVVWALQDGQLSVYAGTGRSAPASDGAAATATPFEAPTGLAQDGGGTVYLTDAADDTLWSVAGGTVHLLAGRSGQAGYAEDTGGSASLLADPTGLAWDVNHLLVADSANHRVRSVSPNGQTGTAAGPYGLTQPVGLLVDTSAHPASVWVADAGDGRVLSLAGGAVTSVAGSGHNALSADGAAAATASLDRPAALAIVSPGRLLVAESGGAVVRSVGPPLGAPARPAAPSVSTGNGRATVSWSAPDDGGSPITSWVLREYEGGVPDPPVPVVGSRSIVVQGLTDGVGYAFTITAVNAWGSSAESTRSAAAVPLAPGQASSSAPAAAAPSPPSSVGLPASSVGPAALLWRATSSFRSTNALPTSEPDPRPTAPVSVAAAERPVTAPTAPATDHEPTPAPDATPSAADGETADLVPVHSLADAATDVATVGRRTAIPLVLIALLVAFLLLQGGVDRRDPKLANAPLDAEPGLEFGSLT